MAKEQLLRKRQRDLDRVCTTFRVDQPSYRFTLETCDNLTGIILDSKGNRVAVFDAENSAVVSKVATYNVCIEGEGTGVAYTEWLESGDTACCDELRQKITELETLLNNIISGSTETGCCEELRTEITNLDQRVTILEQGGGATPECCERLSTEIESLKVRIAALEGKAFIATYNVTTAQEINEYLSSTNEPFAPILVKRGEDYYTVTTAAKQAENKVIIRTFATLSGEFYMFTYTITDGTWASSSYGFQGKLTAGDNITINNNVISATGGGGGLPADFDIVGGTNAQVTKNGNVYTVSATDTNTQTTLLPGSGVTISDGGTDGNHVYTITATGGGGGGDEIDIQSTSPNLTVTVEIV